MTAKGMEYMLIVSSAAVSLFLMSFDINMVNIALPTITKHYALDVGTSTWLIIVPGIILCSLLLPFGKMGDVFGHRRIFLIGMAMFSLFNLFIGLAYHLENFWLLVILRAFAAIGAAMMVSVNFAIVSINLPEDIRGKGLGYFSIFGALGLMLGPFLSGVIIDYLQWNGIFYLNAIIGVCGLCMALAFIPDSETKGYPADLLQTATVFVTILTSTLAINRALIGGLTPMVYASAVIAILALSATLWRQKTAAYPLLAREIIQDKMVMLPLLSMMFLYMCYNGAMILLPFYLEDVEGVGGALMGSLFVIPSLFIIALGPIAGSISDRHGSMVLTLVGTGTMALAMTIFMVMGRVDGVFIASMGLVIMGVSHGLFNAPNNRRIFCRVPMDMVGTASGTHQMIRQIGNVLGSATMPAVFQLLAGAAPTMDKMMLGFEGGFFVGVIYAVAALGMVILIRLVYERKEEGCFETLRSHGS